MFEVGDKVIFKSMEELMKIFNLKTTKDVYENGFYETEIQEEDYDRGDYYLAPLQYELQKWLREKHKLHIIITLGHDENSIWHDYSVLLMDKSYDYNPLASSESGLSSYEEALEAALCDGLNLIKNENYWVGIGCGCGSRP